MALVLQASTAVRARTIALITDAFSHDPVVRWFLPDNDTYPARAVAFFGYLYDVRVAVDGAWVTDGGESAALWSPPGSESFDTQGLWDRAAAAATGLPAFLETGLPSNVTLYERMGFTVTGEIDEPSLLPRRWCLRSEAGA